MFTSKSRFTQRKKEHNSIGSGAARGALQLPAVPAAQNVPLDQLNMGKLPAAPNQVYEKYQPSAENPAHIQPETASVSVASAAFAPIQQKGNNSGMSGNQPSAGLYRYNVAQLLLEDKSVAAYKKALSNKKGLPLANLVKLIKEKLTANNDNTSVEHVKQILSALDVEIPKNISDLVAGNVAVMSLPAFQAKFHSNTGGGIDGYKLAIKNRTKEQADEFPGFIAAMKTTNMFTQHDGTLIRNDVQNAGKLTTNLQVQLGGGDLFIYKRGAKDKSSITCVVVDDTIVSLCLKSPAIATFVLGQLKSAHLASVRDGITRIFTLDM